MDVLPSLKSYHAPFTGPLAYCAAKYMLLCFDCGVTAVTVFSVNTLTYVEAKDMLLIMAMQYQCSLSLYFIWWILSYPATFGTSQSVVIREVASFQGWMTILKNVSAWKLGVPLIVANYQAFIQQITHLISMGLSIATHGNLCFQTVANYPGL